MKKKIMIEGMSCEHCVAHVKEALEPMAKESVEVSLEGKYALLDTQSEDKDLIEALDEAGYDVKSIEKI
ncbi:heavy metal transport/detoxification protein [Sporanaerobium hydrogeniformans]|uniref:Heavy metal transport/detoxification protein n=1 Tax=Sporanaerobium hydrogeniformans TaxID=3072179 RepID=A0AC61D9Z4_9FIRM|nr:heavy-metal-associated domain-containing protein [Sporanaerobium hydrogeniformans]PHV69695.1 heavy metal transport/detoxification protein [Sporanaerobium hydrogeniformans]